jgi:dTDP-4-dehydrorhamnose 3,5-epimerase
MNFVDIPLQGAYLLELDPRRDARGTFCRLFCEKIMAAREIPERKFVQINLSDNSHQGTLRGLHYQQEPHLEAKIIYCLQGSLYDVIVDLRMDSQTYLQYFGIRLSEDDPAALYIPKGFAHGFLTLQDNTRLLYLMSEYYKQEAERGYCYDDPTFRIKWPFQPKVISERDQNFPSFKEQRK